MTRGSGRRLVTALGVLGLFASGCTFGGDDETSESTAGVSSSTGDGSGGSSSTLPLRGFDVPPNTLVWVHDVEPTSLHYDDPADRLAVTSWIRRALLEGLYGVSGATEYYPELLAEEGAVVDNGDGSVTINLKLREGLRWSNGDPLTVRDVEYTWNIWKQGCVLDPDGTIGDGSGCVYRATSRAGLDLISAFTVASDTQFSITMTRFYAGWRGLFDEVYHPLFGATADAVNAALGEWRTPDRAVLPSSGPMIFNQWERGFHLALVRNDQYHGSASPDARNRGVAAVDGVFIRFVQTVDQQIQAIEGGQAHVIMAQPQLVLGERLRSSADFTVASAAGPIYEHWGFNLLNVHLGDPKVREAIAFAADKTAVVKQLYEPLFGPVLPEAGLGNTYWMTNQRAYEDHQLVYAGAQVDQARASLAAAGYVTDPDGIYRHPDRGRLSLRIGTTGGNELRELQESIFAEQMRLAGIEIVVTNVEGDDYFLAQPFATDALLASVTRGQQGDPGLWDIAQFAWAGGAWPGSNSDNYLSAGSSNPYAFANAAFDAQAAVCDATLDNVLRAACYNDLDRFLTTLEKGPDGLVVIPITQKPSFYGYASSVLSGAGIASDADAAGPLANVVDFSFK